MSRWTCARCEHTYSPEEGDMEHGIIPGTPWTELPDDWTCPSCGGPKFSFRQTAGSGREGSGWVID